MKAITDRDLNDLCRLLQMVTRLDLGSHPSAMDKATALSLYRKLRSTESE